MQAKDPWDARRAYLDERRSEISQQTMNSHRSRLKFFCQFMEEIKGYDSLHELEMEDIGDYRTWRRQEGGLTPKSEKSQMDTLRVFLRFASKRGWVEERIPTAVISPSLDDKDEVREEHLDADRAEAVLDHLETYYYASFEHAVFRLMWKGMLRLGGVRAIDLDDVHLNEAAVEINHRPDRGTPIKNGGDGERVLSLTVKTVRVLRDYIDTSRHEVRDDHGRRPLVTTRYGRPAKSTLRNTVYAVTQPCFHGDSCPIGKDLDECDWAVNKNRAANCPARSYPHGLRKGSITAAVERDVPKKAISDRADVSERVLDKHYDREDQWNKMERRRKFDW